MADETVDLVVDENLVGEGTEPKEEVKTEPEVKEVKPDPVKQDEPADESSTVKPEPRGYKRKLQQKNAEIEALKAQLASKEPPKPEANGKPVPDNYQTWDDYNEAKISWEVEQRLEAKLEEKLSKRDQETQRKEVAKTWESKAEAARAKHEDYDEALSEYDDIKVRKDITDAMVESDIGGEIAYYLAKNPQELEAINQDGISAVRIGREIARIESLIAGKSEKAAVKTTKSPPPIVPVKPKATTAKADLEDLEYEEYVKERGYSF